jgi:hypothetical protein
LIHTFVNSLLSFVLCRYVTVEDIFESLSKIEETMKIDANGTATHARLSFNAGTYVLTCARTHAHTCVLTRDIHGLVVLNLYKNFVQFFSFFHFSYLFILFELFSRALSHSLIFYSFIDQFIYTGYNMDNSGMVKKVTATAVFVPCSPGETYDSKWKMLFAEETVRAVTEDAEGETEAGGGGGVGVGGTGTGVVVGGGTGTAGLVVVGGAGGVAAILAAAGASASPGGGAVVKGKEGQSSTAATTVVAATAAAVTQSVTTTTTAATAPVTTATTTTTTTATTLISAPVTVMSSDYNILSNAAKSNKSNSNNSIKSNSNSNSNSTNAVATNRIMEDEKEVKSPLVSLLSDPSNKITDNNKNEVLEKDKENSNNHDNKLENGHENDHNNENEDGSAGAETTTIQDQKKYCCFSLFGFNL